jgi:hypothetical protein
MFPKFNCFPTNPITQIFSNRNYFKQIERKASEIMPSNKHR